MSGTVIASAAHLRNMSTKWPDQMVVDEAIVIIEAWADDRRFYKESAQVGVVGR